MTRSAKVEHRLGVGYTPGYGDGRLALPDGCARVEAGAAVFLRGGGVAQLLDIIPDRAIHLARAPFCEEDDVQDAFVAHLAARLPGDISSIGLHLCGPLDGPGGLFGLGTPFEPNALSIKRAIRLASRLLADVPSKVIHLENANLYPWDIADAMRVNRATAEITRESGARLIVDIAHAVITAHNLGVATGTLLGGVAWDRVDVLHVSGVVRDRRGALHDGHDRVVPTEVWEALKLALDFVEGPVTVVLEHTHESWATRAEALGADWKTLRACIAGTRRSAAFAVDVHRASVGYMENLVLPRHFPEVRAALEPQEWRALVDEWATEFTERSRGLSAYAYLRPEEAFLPPERQINVIEDFASFLQR